METFVIANSACPADTVEILKWAKRHEEELAHDGRQAMMRSVNPAFIPRNHLVEEVLQAAEQNQLEPFQTLMKVLAQPYQNQPDYPSYMLSPRPEQVVHQTFCGT